LNKQSRTVDK